MRKLDKDLVVLILLPILIIILTIINYLQYRNDQEKIRIEQEQNTILVEENEKLKSDLELNKAKLNEMEELNEEYFNKVNELNVMLEEMAGVEFLAEITYYSPLESTNPPGWESMNSMGGQLKEGDWAAPDFIPLHSKILVTYEDGSTEIGTIVDRGNTDIVKIFTRDDEPIKEGAKMRLDKFVFDPTGKGLDIAKVKILRWGSGEE